MILPNSLSSLSMLSSTSKVAPVPVPGPWLQSSNQCIGVEWCGVYDIKLPYLESKNGGSVLYMYCTVLNDFCSVMLSNYSTPSTPGTPKKILSIFLGVPGLYSGLSTYG